MKRLIKAIASICLGFSQISYAANYSMPYGELKVSREDSALDKDKTKENAGWNFVIQPKDGYALNFEGPWMLKLYQPETKTLLHSLDTSALNQDKGLFFIDAAKAKTLGNTFDFELVAFLCTKDKSKCFREVYKGTEKG